MHKLETTLLVCIDQRWAEHEWPALVIEYDYVKGYRQTQMEPGVEEHCTLGSVYAVIDGAHHSLPEWQIKPLTEQLEALCLADWRDRDEAGREQAAEMRAEMRREDDALDRIERTTQADE